MKTFIITQIAKQYRKKVAIARNLQIQHINYMYQYNYIKLIKTLIDSLTLEPQHFNDRFIK